MIKSSVLGLFLAVSALSFASASTHQLVINGQTNYTIVVSDQAIPAELTAAKELQNYVREISGADLKIVKEAEFKGEKMLAVGFNGKLPESLRPAKYGPLGEEELLIDRSGNTLLLAGGRPRGTLYAVYELLDQLGVRWYSPKFTKVPHNKNISWPMELVRYRPNSFARSMTTGNSPDLTWSARNHLTTHQGCWSPVGKEYGCEKGSGPDMHTFHRIVSLNELQAHPEWWMEKDGKRIKPAGEVYTIGVCLAKKSFRDILIDRTMDLARKHPEWDPIWLGHNDTGEYCHCAECTAFYNKHGGMPSSMIVQLINDLAEQVNKEFPGRKVATLAYAYSLKPPVNMKLHPNVMVMFCPMGDFVRPIEDNPKMAETRKAIKGWAGMSEHMAVYLYPGNWNDYWAPTPSTYIDLQDIRWAYENGVDYCFGAISGYRELIGSEWIDLRAWLYARIMWKPGEDDKKLVREFCRDFYGPAGDAVYAVHELTHQDTVDEQGNARSFQKSSMIPYYVNPAVLTKANRLLEQAEKQMKLPQDQAYLEHLHLAWIPYLWSDFWLGVDRPGQYDPSTKTWSVPLKELERRRLFGTRVKQFMVAAGVNALGEVKPLSSSLSTDKVGISCPAHRLSNQSIEAVVVPGLNGQIHEFRDIKTNFTPFKEWYGGQICEYPSQTTTEDVLAIGKTYVSNYYIQKSSPDRVSLSADMGDYILSKEVSLQGRKMSIRYSAGARNSKPGGEELGGRISQMFDLDQTAFGLFPTLYIEMKDGRTMKHVLGTETSFWWITGGYDLSQTTGKMVLCSEVNSRGLIIQVDPAKIPEISYWYDKDDHSFPRDKSFMLRIFYNFKSTPVVPDKLVEVGISLEMVEDYKKLIFSNVYEKE